MYWNCTSPGLGGNRFAEEKKSVITTVVNHFAPDVLCLDEMSASISDDASANSYASNYLDGPGQSYSSGVVVENPGVHLNTSTWIKDGTAYKDVTSGLPSAKWDSDRTKRDLSRVQYSAGSKNVSIWFLHANASRSGGLTAAGYATAGARGTRNVFIGDFNCPIADAGGFAVAPAINGMNFTQWRTDLAFGSAHLGGFNPPIKFDPHGIIDYAICDPAFVTLTAQDTVNPFDRQHLRNYIVYFDHFPIVYDL
jgi:hypothetical protein